MASWEELERKVRPQPEPDAVAERCARVFTTPEGKMLLQDFRAITVDKTPLAGLSDAALRELEGERRFVRRLEHLIERGMQQIEARSKKS